MVGPVAHAIVGYTERLWRSVQSRHREDWSMNEANTTRFVGLDVHRDSIAIAVAMLDGQPAESLAAIPNDVPGFIKRLHRLGPPESLRAATRRVRPVWGSSAGSRRPGSPVRSSPRRSSRSSRGAGQDRPPRCEESRALSPLGGPDADPPAGSRHRGDPRPRAGPRRRQASRTGSTATTLEVSAASWPLVRGQLDLGAGSPGLAGQATVRQQSARRM